MGKIIRSTTGRMIALGGWRIRVTMAYVKRCRNENVNVHVNETGNIQTLEETYGVSTRCKRMKCGFQTTDGAPEQFVL